MGKRIPPKGTVEYRRYWRDRHMMDEIELKAKDTQHCAENTELKRSELYKEAAELLKQAHAKFKAGWLL